MDWSMVTRSEWIALGAAVVSMASAVFTWRNLRISARKERRELSANDPVVTVIDDGQIRDEHPWRRFIVEVTNRHPHKLQIESFTVQSPKDGQLVDRTAFGQIRRDVNAQIEAADLDKASARSWKPIFVYVDAASTGQNRRSMLLYLKRLDRDVTYEVDLSLVEPLADSRRLTKRLKIKLAAAKPSAASDTKS